MLKAIDRQRDFYAGGLMILVGVFAAYVATTYDIGSLADMGPGFFPLVLSVLIAGLGVGIATGAGNPQAQEAHGPMAHANRTGADLRGWIAILAAVVVFIFLGNFAGMAPATFACVFVAAMGDRRNSWKTSGILALGVTIFAVLVLALGLRVQMPIVKGWF